MPPNLRTRPAVDDSVVARGDDEVQPRRAASFVVAGAFGDEVVRRSAARGAGTIRRRRRISVAGSAGVLSAARWTEGVEGETGKLWAPVEKRGEVAVALALA
jgi:hypothetical protein